MNDSRPRTKKDKKIKIICSLLQDLLCENQKPATPSTLDDPKALGSGIKHAQSEESQNTKVVPLDFGKRIILSRPVN